MIWSRPVMQDMVQMASVPFCGCGKGTRLQAPVTPFAIFRQFEASRPFVVGRVRKSAAVRRTAAGRKTLADNSPGYVLNTVHAGLGVTGLAISARHVQWLNLDRGQYLQHRR